MWKHEFTNVHVPAESRFSKYQHCWEYKESRQSMPNAAMKVVVDQAYRLHIELTMEERKDYSRAREAAIESPDETMSIIIDGMDQNTTYVPKFRQSVKGIESRYVKTHLCGVLVHGVGLYCHVWIDAHHKHDSNQVVTSIMKVLQDVKHRRGKLAPVLRIQADNCGRENKNVYIFGLCATLVALGFFKEIQLSFLIVGHTHEDIDQRFSSISSALKHQDIDSLKEFLDVIRARPIHTEPFVHAEHLEHIRDWSKFITPYLRTDAFVGISQPHHFRFYMQENKPHVQYKPYARSPKWLPEHGHVCLDKIPSAHEVVPLASISEPNDRELKALEDFIVLKERHIARHMNVEKCLEAIDEASQLISYLKSFPSKDKASDSRAPFWPNVDILSISIPPSNVQNDVLDSRIHGVLQSLPDVMVTSYFGPRSQMPKGHRIRGSGRQATGQCREQPIQRRSDVGQSSQHTEFITSTSNLLPNACGEDPSFTFNPHADVCPDMFVAMETCDDDQARGIPFFVAKVITLSRQACSDGEAKVLWYQPKMPIGLEDDIGQFNKRYRNCIERGWEPSREKHDVVPIVSIFTSWKNTVGIKNLCTVQNVRTERELKIPIEQKLHLYHHLELINWQYIDNIDTHLRCD
jgi:hypothetical protein